MGVTVSRWILLGAAVFCGALAVPEVHASGFNTGGFWKPSANVAIAAGWANTCTLSPDYSLKCSGRNSEGQLGLGDTTQRLTPVAQSSFKYSRVTMGKDFGCAIQDGSLRCWGNNASYQLGDGTTTTRLTPVQVSGLTTGVTQASAGDAHTCAVVSGAAKCWGSNSSGQLGTGTTSLATIDSDNFNDNSLDATKWNYASEIAGFVSSVTVAEQNSEIEISVPVSNGFGYSGYTAKKAVNFTGGAVQFQLVQSFSSAGCAEAVFTMIVDEYNGYGFVIACGAIGFRYILNNTHNDTWIGYNSAVQKYFRIRHDRSADTINWETSTDGSSWTSQRSIARNLPITSMRATMRGGSYQNETSTGTAKFDDYVLSSDLANSSTPAQVSGLTSAITAVASGPYHSCGLTSAGAVQCWGYNEFGQLGANTTIDSPTPVQVSGLTANVTAISVADRHSCALVSGAVKCWGFNKDGQLGDGTSTTRLTPVQVSGLTSGVTAVVTGGNSNATPLDGGFSCALTSAGAAKCWGSNYSGQLGQNASTATFVDNFNDNALGGEWGSYGDGATYVTETNQRLELTLPNAAGGSDYSGVYTTARYNFTGKQLTFEVVQPPSPVAYSAELAIVVGVDGNNQAAFVLNDSLVMRNLIAGDYNGDTYMPYDRVMHRFLRIRHNTSDDSINWETSPDGVQWTTRRTETRAITITSMGLEIAGGCWMSCANPGTAIVDNFRLDASRDTLSTPTSVSGLTSNVTSLAAGAAHTCALNTSRKRKCWGANDQGQLGYGNRYDVYNPGETAYSLTSGTGWVAPTGVTSATIELWGGGGGGSITANAEGGGGGSAYALKAITVVPGTTYAYSVGSGGSPGNDGGNTTWQTNVAVAEGGKGGSAAGNTAGLGGATANSTGDTRFAGGNGANGQATTTGSRAGSGGGGSATASANGSTGTAGSSNTPGVGGAGAGYGGNGGVSGSDGPDGAFPGGGAGGGGNSGGNGGYGGNGVIKIRYANP
jgi:alpha-tubulin suppressor-like RCC1 family protein